MEFNEVIIPEVYNSADQGEVFYNDTDVDCKSVPVLDDESFSDDMLNQSDVTDSFDDSDNSENDSNCVRARIAASATTFNISQIALAALLSILRQSGLDLPKDPRTLQGTPRDAEIKHTAGGSYHHFGIVNSLCCKLQRMTHTTLVRTLTLNINIDGLPVLQTKLPRWIQNLQNHN